MLSDMLGDFFKAFDGIGLFSCAIKVIPSSELDLWNNAQTEQCKDGTMRWPNHILDLARHEAGCSDCEDYLS